MRWAFPLTVLLHLPGRGPQRCTGSSIVPCPGFPFCASGAVDHRPSFSTAGTSGVSKFFDASLPACRGLRTPADLPFLAPPDGRVLPSGAFKPSASALSHVEAVPALQGARSPLRPTGCAVYASPILFAGLVALTPPWTQDSIRGGWLALTRQGLSPCKRRQAFLAR